MKLEIVDRGANSIKMLIEDASQAVMNSLRRIILTEVPTMAVEEALIIENSSSMADEIVLHRTQYVPFVSDIDNFVVPEECTCGSSLGCDKCVVRYSLNKEADERSLTVYSGDLVPENQETTVVPVSREIPIVILAPGQKISLELYVRVGRGKKHSKWQPGIATMKYAPSVVVDKGSCTLCGKCSEVCAKKVLTTEKDSVAVSRLNDCTLCAECVAACPVSPAAIEVSHRPGSFVAYIESFGFLSPIRMFTEAVSILEKKAERFSSAFEEISKEESEVAAEAEDD